MAFDLRGFPYADFVESNFCLTVSQLNQGQHMYYLELHLY